MHSTLDESFQYSSKRLNIAYSLLLSIKSNYQIAPAFVLFIINSLHSIFHEELDGK